MAIQIYKAAQGRYIRIGTAVAAGLVALVICWYVWYLLEANLGEQFAHKTYVAYAIPGALFVAMGIVAFHYLNKPVVVDFFVATESEMKKVSWPGKAELWGSTLVVIGTVLVLAVLIFIWDWLFSTVFDKMGLW